MKLTIMERVMLPQLYPQASGIVEQVLVKQISEKIAITPDEMKKVGMKTEKYKTKEGEEKVSTRWDDDKYKKDIIFSDAEIQLIKAQVKEFDERKLITQETLSLCLKINDLIKGGKK